MEAQRLRNLTTGILHTELGHVEADLRWILGCSVLLPRSVPKALERVTPWLKEMVTDPRFWDGQYDLSHTGNYHLEEPSKKVRKTLREGSYNLNEK